MADFEPHYPPDPDPADGGYGGYAPPPSYGPPAAAFGPAPSFGPPPADFGPAYPVEGAHTVGSVYPPGGPYPAAPTSEPPTSEPDAAGASRPRVGRVVLVTAVVAAVVGGGVGAGVVAIADHHNRTSSAAINFTTTAAPAARLDGSITAAAAKISPSVVTINVTSQTEQDTGSGIILRTDGYVLTNNHVIANAAGGAGTLTVTLADGRVVSGTIVGQDPSDDLAVVKVSASGLTAATFASSSSLVVGQSVVAVGAPLGLSDTVTSGIVSNTARPVQTGDSSSDQAVFNAVQTDAAINPGNSGGPLVNLNGDVVGVNAAIASDQSSGGLSVPGQPQSQAGNIGIGFAIPSDEAGRIAAELIATGKATHAIIGVTVKGDSTTQSPTQGTAGATVDLVTAGGPAAAAGIKPGDVVTQVNAQRIGSADDLIAAIRSFAPAQKVTITFLRGTAQRSVTVTLGAASS
jgi:putative serine protease PepD